MANATKARRILVVAPATLLLNWRSEIKKWQTLDLPIFVIRPGLVFRGEQEGWYIINYDIAHRYEEQLKREAWCIVILDECQYLKSRSAKRTRALLGGCKIKTDDAREPVPAKRKLLLTGTPIMNRPAELFSLINYLDPARWASWTAFARRYCGGWDGNAMGQGASNLDELQARLRETIMVRRLKADVLTELPPKRRQVVSMEPDTDEAREAVGREVAAYERTEAEIAAATYAMQAAEAEGDEAAYRAAVARLQTVRGIAFTEMAKVRHETALAKLPQVLEHLAAIETGKVIVFAHHKDVVAGLCAALAPEGVVKITGETKVEDRQGIVAKFQTDPSVRFFVGNIKAAGVGLTLTASSHVVFAELDWTPSAISQAEDRAHRIGQVNNVLIQHIVLDGSLDAKMAKMVVAKQEVIEQALDRAVAVSEKDRPAFVAKVATDAAGEPLEELEEKAAAKPAPTVALTGEQVAAIHQALRIVAAMDEDRAQTLNDIGFSKFDTRFGCELAGRDRLSPRQAAAGMKLARKYRRQYPMPLYERIFGEAWG